MTAMTSEVCLAWFTLTEVFTWAKTICKHTRPKVHAAFSRKHTSGVLPKLTKAPHGNDGACSHSHPVAAVHRMAEVLRHAAPRRTGSGCASSSGANLCWALQLSPVWFLVLDPRWGAIPRFYFSYFRLSSVLGKPVELCCAPHSEPSSNRKEAVPESPVLQADHRFCGPQALLSSSALPPIFRERMK